MPFVVSGWRRLVPSLTWQPVPRALPLVLALPPGAVAVDLGAGGRILGARVITVDALPLPGTRLVADVHALPLATDSLDLVLATGLLEHVVDADRVMTEMMRILKPGGVLHLEVPFLTQFHADPIDWRRFTLPGLEQWVSRRGLILMASGPLIGPTTTLITLMAYYAALWWEGDSWWHRWCSNGVFGLVSLVLWPAQFLDRWLIRRRHAHRLAFAVYCTARKASVSRSPT